MIKLYAGNPALNAGAPGSSGSWKQFLDYCYNNNRNPIYVVMMSHIQGGVVEAGGSGLQAIYHGLPATRRQHGESPCDLRLSDRATKSTTPASTAVRTFWTNLGQLIDARTPRASMKAAIPSSLRPRTTTTLAATSWPAIEMG